MWGGPPSVGVCSGAGPRSVPFPQGFGPRHFPLPVLVAPRWFLVPVVCCAQGPCSRRGVPVTPRLPSPLCPGPSLCPVPFWCLGGWVVVGLRGRRWPMGGAALSAATGGGSWGCRGAEAGNRVPVEHFPCSPRHGGLLGGVIRFGGGAGKDFLEGVEALAPLSPARSPCPLHQAAELPQGRGGPPGEVGGGVWRWALSLGSWSGRGRGWGLGMRVDGMGSGRRGAVRRGRGMRT